MPHFATAAASFRERTEDRVLVWSVGEIWIVCVADGSGGVSGAAKAAEMFVAGVRQAIDTMEVDPTDPFACVDLLKVLDREIQRDPVAGETTGIVLAVTQPRLGTGGALPKAFTAPTGGVLVAGTDGLFDYASADALVRLPVTRSRTFPDDVAVIVGWLDEPSPRS